MILGFFTLLIAIAISGVAAYYSILGLVAIFAAAAMPVIIMGSVLEAGKIMTAVWLHRNWHRAGLAYKLYLVPSVVFLMLLTSLSVFGFLSKAHLDQGIPTGDVAAQIELIDTKITTQRENINATRKVLTQMDGAVDEVLARSKTEQGARNANTLRNQQAKDRTKLQDDIGKAQAEIAKLNEERAVVARDLRKIEAEVGPVKYVAALIYGDNPDANLLEKAVRWVIILIVGVFDPLAIVLILAGTKQIEWGLEYWRDRRREREKPQRDAEMITELNGMVGKFQEENTQLYTQIDQLTERNIALTAELTEIRNAPVPEPVLDPEVLESQQQLRDQLAQVTQHAEQLMQEYFNKEAQYKEVLAHLEQLNQDQEIQATLLANALQRDQEAEINKQQLLAELDQMSQELAQLRIDRDALVEDIKQLKNMPAYEPDDGPLTNDQISQIQESVAPAEPEPVLITRMFDPMFNPEAVVTKPVVDFGSEFPHSPGKGDMFLRTDFNPSRLFKWNDQAWIQVNKNTTDVYAYNEMYIGFLIQKLQDREYEWDDLSTTEQQQVMAITGGPIV